MTEKCKMMALFGHCYFILLWFETATPLSEFKAKLSFDFAKINRAYSRHQHGVATLCKQKPLWPEYFSVF